MKKKMCVKIKYAFLLCIVCAISCQIDDGIAPSNSVYTIGASLDGEYTKTIMDLSSYKTMWTAGDRIIVVSKYNDTDTPIYACSLEEYKINLSSGVASYATFSSNKGAKEPLKWGPADGAQYYYAFYSSSCTFTDWQTPAYITFEIPTIQNYQKGYIDSYSIPMLGKGESLDQLIFKPLCSILKVRVYDSINNGETITSIVLNNPKTDHNTGGRGYIAITKGNPKARAEFVWPPYVYPSSDNVTLTGIDELISSDSSSPNTYYIPFKSSINGTITVTINTKDADLNKHSYNYTLNKSFTGLSGSFTASPGVIFQTSSIDLNTSRAAEWNGVSSSTLDIEKYYLDDVWL